LYRDRDYTLLRWLAIYWSISDFMCLGQIGIVLVSGAYFMGQGQLSLGVLSAFLTYIGILIWPVRHLGRVLADAGKALVALERLNEILEVKIETSLGNKEKTLVQCPSIEFDNVSFSFQDGSKVLDSLSFEIEAGETLAILGPTGAGKSTLIQLLLRLYDIDEGVIRLADRDIKSLSRRALRSQMGVVLQESFLYSRTIKENLAFGNSKLSLEELKGYAQIACIGESIEGFSEGYETAVGERGVTLSGGQRQRLALARALARKAPILILDDALSAVDSRTEGFIVQALEERRGRQTTIVISHRLSSVVHADRILVLEKGQAAQCGRHQELLQEEGPYRRLWAIQGQIENQGQQDKDLLPTLMNGESRERNQSEHFQRKAS
jgi:ATP-binding cassette subfamily B protein